MAEKVAASLLAVSGRRAISDLYDVATFVHRFGKPEVVDSLIEIAEAAARLDASAAPVVAGTAASAGVGTVHSAAARGCATG